MEKCKSILSITFNDYSKGGGGVAKVMIEHQKMFNDAGYKYICIFPVKKLIMHDNIMLFCYWGLLIDGKINGIYNNSQIKNILYSLNEEAVIASIHIHHLLYNKMTMVQELIDYLDEIPIAFFIHDYYTVCRNYTLLKNDQYYCGLGGIRSEKCKDCKYYNHLTIKNLKENKTFIEHNIDRLHFFAPSEAARAVWLSYYKSYSDKITVLRHDNVKKYGNHFRTVLRHSSKIKLGYLGRPAVHKGWNTWLKLIDSIDHNKYECYVFNNTDDPGNDKYQHVYVNVTPDNKDAMIKALISNEIDSVLLWSNWPETYSYTYFESYCADEFILTSNVSGNIAYECRNHHNGFVFKDENQLLSALKESDFFIDSINSYRNNHEKIPIEMVPNTKIVDWVKANENNDSNKLSKNLKDKHDSILLKVIRNYVLKHNY